MLSLYQKLAGAPPEESKTPLSGGEIGPAVGSSIKHEDRGEILRLIGENTRKSFRNSDDYIRAQQPLFLKAVKAGATFFQLSLNGKQSPADANFNALMLTLKSYTSDSNAHPNIQVVTKQWEDAKLKEEKHRSAPPASPSPLPTKVTAKPPIPTIDFLTGTPVEIDFLTGTPVDSIGIATPSVVTIDASLFAGLNPSTPTPKKDDELTSDIFAGLTRKTT